MPHPSNPRLRILGRTVKAIREARAIPQASFARAAGISPGHLSSIERHGRQPSWKVVLAIADALAVPLDAITVNLGTLQADWDAVAHPVEDPMPVDPWAAVS